MNLRFLLFSLVFVFLAPFTLFAQIPIVDEKDLNTPIMTAEAGIGPLFHFTSDKDSYKGLAFPVASINMLFKNNWYGGLSAQLNLIRTRNEDSPNQTKYYHTIVAIQGGKTFELNSLFGVDLGLGLGMMFKDDKSGANRRFFNMTPSASFILLADPSSPFYLKAGVFTHLNPDKYYSGVAFSIGKRFY